MPINAPNATRLWDTTTMEPTINAVQGVLMGSSLVLRRVAMTTILTPSMGVLPLVQLRQVFNVQGRLQSASSMPMPF